MIPDTRPRNLDAATELKMTPAQIDTILANQEMLLRALAALIESTGLQNSGTLATDLRLQADKSARVREEAALPQARAR